MATSESNGQSNSFEPPIYKFPPWLEDIIPLSDVVSRIKKKGLVNDVADICADYYIRMEQAKKLVDNITVGYAYEILDNLIYDTYRKIESELKKGKGKQIISPQVAADPTENIIKKEEEEKRIRLVELAINKLGLGLREQVIIRLKVYRPQKFNRPQKFTFKEIANIVGFSESTVRVEYNTYFAFINNYVKQGMSENA